MRQHNPARANLFRNTLIIFLLTLVLLASAYKGVAWLKKPQAISTYQDKKAVAAFTTVVASLRPEQIAQQRLVDVATVQQLSQCKPNESAALFAAVQTIEQRLAEMAGFEAESGRSQVGNYQLPQRLVIDGTLWAAALQANKQGNQQATKVECVDLQRGLRLFARNEAQALLGLEWTIPAKAEQLDASRPKAWANVPNNLFTRSSPWGGLPGCLFMGGYYVDTGKNSYCATANAGQYRPLAVKDTAKPELAYALPDSLNSMLREVDRMRLPGSLWYQAVTQGNGQHGPNQHQLDGHVRNIGWHSHLTLQLRTQTIAQQTARCYTGDQAACTALGLSKKDSASLGNTFYEQAAVRMTGIAIIDVKTGEIEALASAHTPCFAQQYDGPGRDKACPALPRPPRRNPDMLLNHAVFTDAMPASTIKPILALGFLQTPGYGVNDADLTEELKTSDSKAFLNRLLCFGSGNKAACDRPFYAKQAAEQLGWNLACPPENGLQNQDCGFTEMLFGRRVDERVASQEGLIRPVGMPVLNGRLLASFSTSHLRDKGVNAKSLETCQAGGWEKCTGAAAAIVSEGYGQGNARATPLGVASMFARLGAAANGQGEQARTHLLQQMTDNQGKAFPLLGKPSSIEIPSHLAKRVVEALRQGHKGKQGTATEACGKAQIGDCAKIDWVAGKTGTPTFKYDNTSLNAIAKTCAKGGSTAACSQEIPYKWYAALFQSGQAGASFDKAIAVLSERNWHESSGLVDAPNDRGSNRSAEIAFRIMAKLRKQ